MYSMENFNKKNIMFKLPSVQMILNQQGIDLPTDSLWYDDARFLKDCYGRFPSDIKKYIKQNNDKE